ncbi:alkaline-phosphatase-like protein [Ochromonadaceae sp. CCMP2298]|nr:alkaline-phosphatase-like protein [Ochromonadaceae sp. CCMP2298]
MQWVQWVWAIALLLSVAQGQIQRPNIVVVLLDDVGWNDLGYNSPLSPIPTPHIDRLSSSGVRLTQHYTHSVCTPSRAALLTGKYHINTGLTNVLLPGSPVGLSR